MGTLEFLEFMFRSFWTFCGIIILIYMPIQALVYIIYYICKCIRPSNFNGDCKKIYGNN